MNISGLAVMRIESLRLGRGGEGISTIEVGGPLGVETEKAPG
jgi:hypothetical protein